MNKFTELKNKITTYLDEHPGVKKGLKIGLALLGAGVSAYAGYKIGTSGSKKNEVPQIPDTHMNQDTTFRPITDPIPLPGEVFASNRKDIPLVEDKHSFDMTFTDLTTGDKFTAKDSCLGYYVNDVLGSFEDTPIQIVTEEAVKEIAETAADIVEEVSTQDA